MDVIYQVNLKELQDNSRHASAMSKALTESSIKRTTLDSTEHERDVEMRYEQSRAKMILSHSYTKEVAENHQASNLLRRDLVALAASLRQELQSRMADTERVSASVQQQIRQSARLNIELGKMIRQQAAAAPPIPSPPLDVAGLGIALINAVGMIGSAWGPNRPPLPPAQTPQTPQTPQFVPATAATMQPRPTAPPGPPIVNKEKPQTDGALLSLLELEMERAGGDVNQVINKLAEAIGTLKGRATEGHK
jgi:hypothetical protein